YRLKKFARRNKTGVLAGAAIATAIVVGGVVASWQAVRATRAESQTIDRLRAEAQARKEAEAVTEFLVTTFESPDPVRNGRTITVAEVLSRAEKRLDEELSDQPLVEVALLTAIGRSRIGLGVASDAVEPLKRALELRKTNLGPA